MAGHVAILLPGRAYGVLGPAIRLPRLAVEQTGAEVVEVEYPVIPAEGDAGAWARLHASVADQVTAALSDRRPDKVTFIAKSMGTVLLAALSPEVALPPHVDAIWLTAIFGQEPVRLGAMEQRWPSLLVAGEADELHRPEHHQAVARSLGAASLVLPRADHNLEVPGDVRATLDGFGRLVETVLAFVER